MVNNYAPFTTAPIPDTGMGPMSGIRRADADEMLRRIQELGLEGAVISNDQSRANLGRYNQMTPHEVSLKQSAADTAAARATPGYLQSMVGGEMAGHEITGMNRDFQRDTQPGKIEETNSAAAIAALQNNIMRVRAIAAQAGPLAAQGEWQKVIAQAGPMGKMLPTHYTPQAMEEVMKVLADTPKHRQTMEQEREQSRRAEAVGAGNNAATIEAARIRAANIRKSLVLQFQSAKTPEMALTYGEMLLTDPELEEGLRRQVEAGVNTARRIIAEKNAKGGFDMANPRGGTGAAADAIRDRLNPNQGQQPNSQGAAGQPHSMGQLKQMYPGVSDQQLREAYKRRFGVEPLGN